MKNSFIYLVTVVVTMRFIVAKSTFNSSEWVAPITTYNSNTPFSWREVHQSELIDLQIYSINQYNLHLGLATIFNCVVYSFYHNLINWKCLLPQTIAMTNFGLHSWYLFIDLNYLLAIRKDPSFVEVGEFELEFLKSILELDCNLVCFWTKYIRF